MQQDQLKVIEKGPFLLTFDWFTPRPHMIIVGNPGHDKKFLKSMIPDNPKFQESNFVELTKNEKACLIEIGRESYKKARDKFGIMEKVPGLGSAAVLSFHFGNWFAQSKVNHFHAHVCIDISVYQAWIETYKQDTVLKETLKKTKTQTLDVYLKKANVPPKDYSQYDIKDVKDVLKKQNMKEDEKLRSDINVSLAYHPKYLRLGFVSEEQVGVKLLEEMDDFIIRNGLHKDRGGHICIDLSNEGFPGYKTLVADDIDKPQPNVKGYLQLEGKSFGMILRAFGKELWLENDHSGSDMAVYT